MVLRLRHLRFILLKMICPSNIKSESNGRLFWPLGQLPLPNYAVICHNLDPICPFIGKFEYHAQEDSIQIWYCCSTVATLPWHCPPYSNVYF